MSIQNICLVVLYVLIQDALLEVLNLPVLKLKKYNLYISLFFTDRNNNQDL